MEWEFKLEVWTRDEERNELNVSFCLHWKIVVVKEAILMKAFTIFGQKLFLTFIFFLFFFFIVASLVSTIIYRHQRS